MLQQVHALHVFIEVRQRIGSRRASLRWCSWSDASADSGTCLTGTKVLATVPPGGGSKCSFKFSGSYTPGRSTSC